MKVERNVARHKAEVRGPTANLRSDSNDIGTVSDYTEITLRLRRHAMTLAGDSASPCALCEPNEVRSRGGYATVHMH